MALPCLAVFLAACGAGEFDLEIVRAPSECDQKPFTTAPNGYLVVRVDGEGMDSVEFSGPAGSIEFDPIEAGDNRQITVKLYSDEKRNFLTAMGKSAPFSVGPNQKEPVRVVLYEAGAFRMAADQQGQCSQLRQARAGHTAVRLRDGRVLLAGGFQEINADGQGVHTLRSAEVFDPLTGRFEALPDMPASRALAQGVLLNDGRVLLVGGETESGGRRIALDEALIFDPNAKGNPWSPPKQLHVARRGHTVTPVGQSGEVLVVGGIGNDGEVVETVEFFDPLDENFHKVDGFSSMGRAFHVAAAVNIGTRPGVLIAGGIDAEGKPTRKLGLVVRGVQKRYEENPNVPLELSNPAVKATGVWVDGVNQLTIIGGYLGWNTQGGLPGDGRGEDLSGHVQVLPIAELNKPGRARAWEHTSLRGPSDACGVAAKRQALAIGGLLQERNRNPAISNTGILVAFPNSGEVNASTNLNSRNPRLLATCTDLGDGMVLLAGGAGSASSSDGEQPAAGSAKALRNAEVYVFR